MVSFWRGNYIFINRGPDVVVVLIDVAMLHMMCTCRGRRCEPNRQARQTDSRTERNRIDTARQSAGVRQPPPNHHFYCILLPASTITALKLPCGKCALRFSSSASEWVCVCALGESWTGEWFSVRTMEIILCTCAPSLPLLATRSTKLNEKRENRLVPLCWAAALCEWTPNTKIIIIVREKGEEWCLMVIIVVVVVVWFMYQTNHWSPLLWSHRFASCDTDVCILPFLAEPSKLAALWIWIYWV